VAKLNVICVRPPRIALANSKYCGDYTAVIAQFPNLWGAGGNG